MKNFLIVTMMIIVIFIPVITFGQGGVIPERIVVTAVAPAEGPGLWTRFWTWVGSLTKDDAMNVVDVGAEATGVPPPGTVSDAVDITKEATPSIMEKVENIKEYRKNVDQDGDTLGIYNNPDNIPENPTLSQRFFRWLNNIIK